MKRFLSVLLLSCLSLSIATAAQASIDTQQSQLEFEQALCRQDWRKALQISTELMNSPDVSQGYRNFLEAFEPMLTNYQRRAAWLPNDPWCGSGISDYQHEAQGIMNLRPHWSGRISNGGQAASGSGDGSYSAGSSGASEGNCQYPTDRDAAGNLCGDRAASVRAGGQ